LIMLIDMNKQNIENWKKLFSLSLGNVFSKDIPIIESVTLFDWNQVEVLSVENITHSSIYH
jgi:hypothetical protein